MNYVIFDLEWDNYCDYKKNISFNEIIEIGAIKLDSNMNITDTFKELVKPKYLKKLSKRCTQLTNITYSDIVDSDYPFETAINDFEKWSGGEDTVFLSWSKSDLYALAQYYSTVFHNCNIGFIKKFCDAQAYCMSFVPEDKKDGNNQLSLAYCAEVFGIETDTTKLHRALTDCYVTSLCIKHVFDREKIKKLTNKCDNDFFDRLLYKPYLIVKPHTSMFDIDNVNLFCPECNAVLNKQNNITVRNKAFNFAAKCPNCGVSYWAFVRAKKNYDSVDVKKRIVKMNRRKAKHYQ